MCACTVIRPTSVSYTPPPLGRVYRYDSILFAAFRACFRTMTFSPSHARMSALVAPDIQDLTVLPNETLTTIFEHLGNDSLVSLVRVCRRFQGIGERLLYCNIVIVESIHRDSDGYMSPQQTEGCCTAVLLRPYLASNTKKISIRWQHDSRHVQDDFELAPSVAPGLRYLLRSAHSLEILELHLAGYRGSWHDLLDGYSFQLRCVALSGPVNAPVEWFLSTQPNIIHLNLGDHRLPLRLAARDLPSLETFRGDARTAASILPGRPVQGLALSGQEPSVECLIAFAYTRLPIRRLDLGGLSITPRQLLTISKHLTAVESLRMRLALRHTLHFTFSGMVSNAQHCFSSAYFDIVACPACLVSVCAMVVDRNAPAFTPKFLHIIPPPGAPLPFNGLHLCHHVDRGRVCCMRGIYSTFRVSCIVWTVFR